MRHGARLADWHNSTPIHTESSLFDDCMRSKPWACTPAVAEAPRRLSNMVSWYRECPGPDAPCSPPTMSLLPADLVDQICFTIDGDASSLRTCSLVCKNWRFSAQHILFAKVQTRLSCTLYLDPEVPMCSLTGPSEPKCLEALLRVGPSVRTLVVSLKRGISVPSSYDQTFTPSGLAEALCGVRTLHIIACAGCGYISYKSILVWAPSFSFVEALHLDRVQFTSSQEFLSLPFSELEYVSLDNIHFIQASSVTYDTITGRLQPVGPPYDIATLRGLRTKAIKLGHRDTSHLQRLLTALPEIERLDTRVPPDVSPGDRTEAAESVWLQLKELRGHVYDVSSCERHRNAEWMFSNSSLASDHMRHVRSTIPTKLAKLELTFKGSKGCVAGPALSTLFEDLTMPRLRRLHLTFLNVPQVDYGGAEDCEVLGRFHAPVLEHVGLLVNCGTEDPDRQFEVVCNLFASVAKRGILHARQLGC
jgi:hypothetical protein